MATPFPRLTPAQFGNPANLRFAYSGCQTVVYNRNVMCNKNPKFREMVDGGIRAALKFKIFMKSSWH
jgi:hypothetical protein